MKKFRGLGHNEVMESYINCISPHNIVVAGVIEEYIDNNILKEAAEVIKNQNPLLQANISSKNKYVNFELIKDNNTIIVDFYHDNGLDIDSKLQDLIALELTSCDGPLMRVIHVRKNDNSIIFMVIQHTISDGVSALELFNEFIMSCDEIMSGHLVEPNIKTLKPSLDTLVKGEEDLFSSDKFNQFIKNSGLSTGKMKNLSTGVLSIKLNNQESMRVLRASKNYNVTVTALICSVFSYLMYLNQENINDTKVSCKILVNMRNKLSQKIMKNDLGFYSSCISFDIDVKEHLLDKESAYQEINDKIKSLILSGQHNDNIFNRVNAVNSIKSKEHLIDAIKEERLSVGVSNMGIVDVSSYKNINILDLMIGCDTHNYDRTDNSIFVCVNTVKNLFYINLMFCQPVFTKDKAKKIGREFKEMIHAISEPLYA